MVVEFLMAFSRAPGSPVRQQGCGGRAEEHVARFRASNSESARARVRPIRIPAMLGGV